MNRLHAFLEFASLGNTGHETLEDLLLCHSFTHIRRAFRYQWEAVKLFENGEGFSVHQILWDGQGWIVAVFGFDVLGHPHEFTHVDAYIDNITEKARHEHGEFINELNANVSIPHGTLNDNKMIIRDIK